MTKKDELKELLEEAKTKVETALLKICGCGYEKIVKKEKRTTCPECGANDNWEFISVSRVENAEKKREYINSHINTAEDKDNE